MEISTPEWLNENFLTRCLSGDNSNSLHVKVTSFQAEQGVPAGNNFGSQILRVRVKYSSVGKENTKSEKTASLIIKAPVKNAIVDVMGEVFEECEASFYYSYLPKVQELIQVLFAPKCYFSPLNGFIVLEDLKEVGFSMADRHDQLDFEHCKQYFATSAKLHAAGIALIKKYPELPEMHPNTYEYIKRDKEKHKLIFHTNTVGLTCLIKALKPLNSPKYKTIIESLKKLKQLISTEVLQDFLNKEFELQKGNLHSLVHGDCSTTNMMFKYNSSGKPIEVRLLDFQNFNYAAIVMDVVHFTWMSANNDVLENHLDELYKYYCDVLNSSLKDLGCEVRYPYNQLMKEILERSIRILLNIAVLLPFSQQADGTNNVILFSEDLAEDQFMQLYQGEHFWKKFPKVLEIAANQGLFDLVEDMYRDLRFSNLS